LSYIGASLSRNSQGTKKPPLAQGPKITPCLPFERHGAVERGHDSFQLISSIHPSRNQIGLCIFLASSWFPPVPGRSDNPNLSCTPLFPPDLCVQPGRTNVSIMRRPLRRSHRKTDIDNDPPYTVDTPNRKNLVSTGRSMPISQ